MVESWIVIGWKELISGQRGKGGSQSSPSPEYLESLSHRLVYGLCRVGEAVTAEVINERFVNGPALALP